MTSDRVLNIMALMNELEGPTNAYRHSVRRATRTASDSPENEAAKARGTAALLDIEQAVRHWVATHPATDDRMAHGPYTVAYRSRVGTGGLRCLEHAPTHPERILDWMALTSDDLEDGGMCSVCGRDVLIRN
jgi:hypothetical protein